MKSLDIYIQEKYLIDLDTNNDPVPDKIDFDAFNDWLKNEFNLNKAFTINFKIDFLQKLDLDIKDFQLLNYDNYDKKSDIEMIKNSFKKIENIDHNILISNKDIDIYFFKLRSSGILLPTLFITDKSKNILYIFTVNIFL